MILIHVMISKSWLALLIGLTFLFCLFYPHMITWEVHSTEDKPLEKCLFDHLIYYWCTYIQLTVMVNITWSMRVKTDLKKRNISLLTKSKVEFEEGLDLDDRRFQGNDDSLAIFFWQDMQRKNLSSQLDLFDFTHLAFLFDYKSQRDHFESNTRSIERYECQPFFAIFIRNKNMIILLLLLFF